MKSLKQRSLGIENHGKKAFHEQNLRHPGEDLVCLGKQLRRQSKLLNKSTK